MYKVYKVYPPPCRRPHWRDLFCRELHPQPQFYEFPGSASSLSSTRFQVEPPGGAPGFLWCCFLRGGMELACGSRRGSLPPSGAHFRHLASSWRSWALSWIILALSGRILSPSCSKMAPRWPNIAQHSAKMSQHSLQEQPQDPKKPSKVMNYRRFFGFRHFSQDRAQDPTKVAKMLPKVRQVGHLGLQVGHLGHILAPSWPTWRHLGPSWRQDAPQ